MRTEILQVVGTAGWVLVIALLVSERRLLRRLRAAAAVNPETATPLPPPRSPITRFRLARLQKSRAVVAAGNGRFYLDTVAYARYRRARRRRGFVVIAMACPVMLFLWWRGVFR
jgi:hypothetical protein